MRDRDNRARLLREHVEPVPTSTPARGEAVALATDVLARLPPDVAEAAVYYYCDEMTHDEIAALMRCSRRHIGHLLERLHVTTRSTRCG